MPVTPKHHWMIRLKRSHKIHFVCCDEFDKPRLTTLCGKPYAPDDRIAAKKGDKITATELIQTTCQGCLKVLRNAYKAIDDLFAIMGLPKKEAREFTDKVLNMERSAD